VLAARVEHHAQLPALLALPQARDLPRHRTSGFFIVDHERASRSLPRPPRARRARGPPSSRRIRDAEETPRLVPVAAAGMGRGIPGLYCSVRRRDARPPRARCAQRHSRARRTLTPGTAAGRDFLPPASPARLRQSPAVPQGIDVLDVLFDFRQHAPRGPGSHPNLDGVGAREQHKSDVIYFEGPTHRGWFNSLADVGVAWSARRIHAGGDARLGARCLGPRMHNVVANVSPPRSSRIRLGRGALVASATGRRATFAWATKSCNAWRTRIASAQHAAVPARNLSDFMPARPRRVALLKTDRAFAATDAGSRACVRSERRSSSTAHSTRSGPLHRDLSAVFLDWRRTGLHARSQ